MHIHTRSTDPQQRGHIPQRVQFEVIAHVQIWHEGHPLHKKFTITMNKIYSRSAKKHESG